MRRSPGSPGRRSGSDGRGAIIAAATHAIADVGIAAVTARSIAEAAGVSLGTLTHHFPSLDALLAVALERASDAFMDAIERAPARAGSARVRLLQVLHAALPDGRAGREQWRLWIQYWSRAIYDPSLQRTHRKLYRRWRAVLRGLIDAGVASGEFAPVDTAAWTNELVNLFDGLCLARALGDPEASGPRVHLALRRWIDARLQPPAPRDGHRDPASVTRQDRAAPASRRSASGRPAAPRRRRGTRRR